MKTKDVISSMKILNLLIALPLILFMLQAFCSCASGKKAAVSGSGSTPPPAHEVSSSLKTDAAGEEIPFVVVEEMPVFPGGDSVLLDFIARNTKYPETAKANKVEGRVILRFCVTENGNVNKISVIRSVDPDLDAEAMRVAATLPPFKPGRQGGKDVPVWYMVPITFALK